MIGWSLFVIVIGFVARPLALRPEYPLRWHTALLLGLLLLNFLYAVPRPACGATTRRKRLAQLRAFRLWSAQRPAQHMFRVSLACNLNCTNPASDWCLRGVGWHGRGAAARHRSATAHVSDCGADLDCYGHYCRAQAALRWISYWWFPTIRVQWLPLPLLPAALAFALVRWFGRGLAPAPGFAGGLVFWATGVCSVGKAALGTGARSCGRAGNARGRVAWQAYIQRSELSAATLAAKALVLMAVIVPLLTGALDLSHRRRIRRDKLTSCDLLIFVHVVTARVTSIPCRNDHTARAVARSPRGRFHAGWIWLGDRVGGLRQRFDRSDRSE